MKLPVTLRASRRGKRSSTSLSLRPDLVRGLGLLPGTQLCAVLGQGCVMLCRPEQAEMWERVYEDFPSFFIGEGKGQGSTRSARKGQPAGGSGSQAARPRSARAKEGE